MPHSLVVIDNTNLAKEIIRPDGHAAIATEVVGMFEGLKLVNETIGRFQAGGLAFVASGVWCDEGEII